MFYDNFIQLCNSVNKSPSAVVQELGMNKSAVTNWKNRQTPPRDATLRKIADYFDVTVDYLLNGESVEIKKSPDSELSEDDELNEYLETLKNNPGMRTLFSKTKNATKEDIEKVIKMIDIMKGDFDGGYYY